MHRNIISFKRKIVLKKIGKLYGKMILKQQNLTLLSGQKYTTTMQTGETIGQTIRDVMISRMVKFIWKELWIPIHKAMSAPI